MSAGPHADGASDGPGPGTRRGERGARGVWDAAFCRAAASSVPRRAHEDRGPHSGAEQGPDLPRLAAPCGLSASLTAVHRTAPLPVASLPLAMFTRRRQQRHTARGLSWVPAPCALQERVQLPPLRSPRCAVAAGQQGPGLLSRSSPCPQRPGPARSRELPPRHGAFAPTLPCECRARGHRVSSVLHRAADLCGPPWPLAVCPAPRPRGRHRRALGRCACRVVSAQCRGRGDLPPPGRPPPAVPAVPRVWDPAPGSRRGA